MNFFDFVKTKIKRPVLFDAQNSLLPSVGFPTKGSFAIDQKQFNRVVIKDRQRFSVVSAYEDLELGLVLYLQSESGDIVPTYEDAGFGMFAALPVTTPPDDVPDAIKYRSGH